MTTPKTPETTPPHCGDYHADSAATSAAPLKTESSYIGLRRRSDEQLPRGPENKPS